MTAKPKDQMQDTEAVSASDYDRSLSSKRRI